MAVSTLTSLARSALGFYLVFYLPLFDVVIGGKWFHAIGLILIESFLLMPLLSVTARSQARFTRSHLTVGGLAIASGQELRADRWE